ncbi:factor-independent urate hydroxylase [Micromonospora marina]|uniref:factor-independent urate hydroxylase n=1 Tax=Micromonospora marina TaxID=307120 RepID=UPI0034553AFC
MGIVLGPNSYGKAEVRLVHVDRVGDRHAVRDLDVGTALAGDLEATHLTGDNSRVLPTDSQKNTVYAFARRHGVGSPEAFALLLASHFVDSQEAVRQARVSVREHPWQRLGPHSFQRGGGEVRTADVSHDGARTQVVSGISGLVLMNTTNSEFHGYVRDEYTTLPETTDRILATAVDARWRHLDADADWDTAYGQVRSALVAAFVETYSRSLQQTLYEMGRRVLDTREDLAEIRLSLPNRHHLPVDLSPFGLDNPNRVFVATDRPYGLIEGTVCRDDAPPGTGDW